MKDKDLMKIFTLEMRIDTNLNNVTKTVNTVRNYFDNKWNSDLEEADIIDMLDDAENILKYTNDILNKLVEEYEKYYVK